MTDYALGHRPIPLAQNPEIPVAARLESFYKWLEYGVDHGYCSEWVCDTHDGLPLTPEEEAEWEAGGDPCLPAVRLYPDGPS